MKKGKKLFSVLLCLLLAVLPLTVSAAAATATYSPYVLVHGSQDIFTYEKDGTQVELYEEFGKALKEALPKLGQDLLTGSYFRGANLYYDQAIENIYRPYQPAPDGTIPANTGVSKAQIAQMQNYKGVHNYNMTGAFEYFPDIRLSPLAVADDLKSYIDVIREKTGQDKVILVSVCEGASTVLSYLYKYERANNYAGVEDVIFMDCTLRGVPYVEAFFSGSVDIPEDGGYHFLKMTSFDDGTNKTFVSLFMKTMDILKDIYGFKVASTLLTKLYQALNDGYFQPALQAFYGRSLGVWSCVYENFEQSIDYVFPTQSDKTAFANIISAARDFRYNVMEQAPALIDEMRTAGVGVNFICEYGFQQYPLSEETEIVGDYLAGVNRKSFGATAARVEETLSDDYIASRAAAGYGAYISPDRQIDASTGLYPEHTWYVKNLNHLYTNEVKALCAAIAREDLTVNTSEQYPQFLTYESGSAVLVPAAEINKNDKVWRHAFDLFGAIRSFFETMLAKFKSLFGV